MHCKNTAFNPVTAQIKPCSFFFKTSSLQQHWGRHFQRKCLELIHLISSTETKQRSIAAAPQIPHCLTSTVPACSPLLSPQRKVFLQILGKCCHTSTQSSEGCVNSSFPSCCQDLILFSKLAYPKCLSSYGTCFIAN